MRVVIFNDSPTVRARLRAVLRAAPQFEVVAEAPDGRDAVRVCRDAQAELVLMDVVMPHVGGFVATRAIVEELGLPVVIVSAVIDVHDPDELFSAMRAGAVFAMSPPFGQRNEPDSRIFLQTLLSIVDVPQEEVSRTDTPVIRAGSGVCALLAIGASAGGPGATSEFLAAAEAVLPPTVLVQHLARGFSESYARWLARSSGVEVRVAKHGDLVESGVVLLAPDGLHTRVEPNGIVRLVEQRKDDGAFCPSADVLFESLATWGDTAVALVLSGMGADGARGAQTMRDAGGRVWIQDEASCAVFGMPRATLRRAGADAEGAPRALAQRLIRGE